MSEHKKRAFTPNMETPTPRKKSSRGKAGIALSILLPPIGIAFLWRKGVFRTRGRMLITALSTIWMAVLMVMLIPTSEIMTISPAPAAPAAATVAPSDGVVTALSNIDQLLAERQAAEAAANPSPTPELDDAALIAQHNAEQQAILETVVYSVFNNAKLYHSVSVCGTQSNRRALTVEEAMNQNMGACPNCSPPVFEGFK